LAIRQKNMGGVVRASLEGVELYLGEKKWGRGEKITIGV